MNVPFPLFSVERLVVFSLSGARGRRVPLLLASDGLVWGGPRAAPRTHAGRPSSDTLCLLLAAQQHLQPESVVARATDRPSDRLSGEPIACTSKLSADRSLGATFEADERRQQLRIVESRRPPSRTLRPLDESTLERRQPGATSSPAASPRRREPVSPTAAARIDIQFWRHWPCRTGKQVVAVPGPS